MANQTHVNLPVNYPPKVRLSELVNSSKGVSSQRIKQEFLAISTFWSVRNSKGHLWSPLAILRKEAQNRPKAGALLVPTLHRARRAF
jgi:hypothetical protein